MNGNFSYCNHCGGDHEMIDCPKIGLESTPASACSRCADHEKLLRIFGELDEIMHTMRPRYVNHPTMDGRYPCWIVWLPKTGKTEYKTLKDAMIEYVDQVAELHRANGGAEPSGKA